MRKELDVEYCYYCDDIYAVYPTLRLMFGGFEGESLVSDHEIFECPRCENPIKRYEGFLDVLKKRESNSLVENTLNEIEDLTEKSKEKLKVLLEKFSVPSFAVVAEGNVNDQLREMSNKRYVYTVVTENTTIITLNAFKLGLFDNRELLLTFTHQKDFINNPEHLRNDGHGYLRRKARMSDLPNDFTDEQKDEVLALFEGKCAFTGKDVPIQWDHVIPVASETGGTIKANMLPVGQRINSSKGAKNVFEWYEENGERFEVCPERFRKAIEYIAELNGMTYEEYQDYVYSCFEEDEEQAV